MSLVSLAITPPLHSLAMLPNGNIAGINFNISGIFIYGQDGSTITTIQLPENNPSSIAIDPNGTIFVAFPGSHTIYQKYANASNMSIIQTVASTAKITLAVSPVNGELYYAQGNAIYSLTGVVASTNSTIWCFSIGTNDTFYAATTNGLYRISGGISTLIASGAWYVSVSPDGAIYCIDFSSNLVKVNADTTTTTLVEVSKMYSGASILALSSMIFTSSTTVGGLYRFDIFSNDYVPCFLANAPVRTPTGYSPISSLSEGDKVVTGDGRVVAIQRVSHTRVAAGASVNPYVLPKGLYGATARLHISPNHRVFTEKGFLEARLLGLKQENMTGVIDYYNLELPSWSQDTMVVAGVVVESLAPVRRATMTLGEFKKALVAQYGELTPAVLAKVQKTCRLVANGRVECPAISK